MSWDHVKGLEDPSRLQRQLAWILRELRLLPRRPESIAFRGHSGAIVAYPASAITGIRLSHVAKLEDPPTHSPPPYGGPNIRGLANPRHYVVVDDFISGAHTMKTIINTMPSYAVCDAILLYNSFNDHDNRFPFIPLIHGAHETEDRYGSLNLFEEIRLWQEKQS